MVSTDVNIKGLIKPQVWKPISARKKKKLNVLHDKKN